MKFYFLESLLFILNDIAFDQYNSKIDPFNQLEELWNKKKKLKLYNMTIITISSLNDEDIKEYKFKSLFKEAVNKDIPITYIEITDLLDSTRLSLDDKEVDDKLDYIGRNYENFNNICGKIKDKKNVDAYIAQKKANGK